MRGRAAGKGSTSGLSSGKRAPLAEQENARSLLSTHASGLTTRGDSIGTGHLHKHGAPRVEEITPSRSKVGASAASAAAVLEAHWASLTKPLHAGRLDHGVDIVRSKGQREKRHLWRSRPLTRRRWRGQRSAESP